MKKIFLIFGLTLLLSAALIALAMTGEVIKDPVCGMEIDPAKAAATIEGKGGALYFCSDQCKEAFYSNPTAYVTQEELDHLGIDVKASAPRVSTESAAPAEAKAAESASCEECPNNVKAQKPKTCPGGCGQTRVKAINDFHVVMWPMETAVAEGNIAVVRAGCENLASKKNAVMKAECPEGIQPEAFKKARADWGAKVDALVSACRSGDDESIQKAFDDMHVAYEALDHMAR
jgi:Cu+-exporting ATPase